MGGAVAAVPVLIGTAGVLWCNSFGVGPVLDGPHSEDLWVGLGAPLSGSSQQNRGRQFPWSCCSNVLVQFQRRGCIGVQGGLIMCEVPLWAFFSFSLFLFLNM